MTGHAAASASRCDRSVVQRGPCLVKSAIAGTASPSFRITSSGRAARRGAAGGAAGIPDSRPMGQGDHPGATRQCRCDPGTAERIEARVRCRQCYDRMRPSKGKGPTTLKISLSLLLGLMLSAAPARAEVEQCRFIQAKPEREACYARQEAALAAKRKPEPTRRHEYDRIAAADAAGRRRGLPEPAQHLPRLLSGRILSLARPSSPRAFRRTRRALRTPPRSGAWPNASAPAAHRRRHRRHAAKRAFHRQPLGFGQGLRPVGQQLLDDLGARVSSSASGTTSCTRPMRRASSAPKRSPVSA